MKKIKLLTSFLVILLGSMACSLIGTKGTPGANQPPSATSLPTLPAEPVANFPAISGEITFASDRGGKWQVLDMYADGSHETSLTANFGEFSFPAWSPDGMTLAMRVETGSGNGIATMPVTQSGSDLAGLQPTPINSMFSDAPSWSPDGSQILYIASESSGWQFMIYNLADKSVRQLTGMSMWARDPRWSPDGQKIVFSDDVNNNGNSDIYIINIDGSGPTRLTSNPYYEGSPNWSPDGSQIVYSAAPDKDSSLYIMNADGSNPQQLTSDPGNAFDAAWSPDGTRIAFTSTRNENNDGNYEIYVIDLANKVEMRLTNNHSTDRFPTWRPKSQAVGQEACSSTGTFLADVSIPPGTRFAAQASATRVWRVQNNGVCTWTPNAFRLRFTGGDLLGAPVVIPMPGAIQPGASVDIPVPFTSPVDPGTHQGTWQLWDAASQPVRDQNGNPLDLSINIEVLPAGTQVLSSRLYFLAGAEGQKQVWRMEPDGHTTAQLTNEAQDISRFEVNPLDGRLALITNHQLVLLNPADGSRQVLVAGDEQSSPWRPAWSNDGSQLAYGMEGIHILDMASNQDRLILPDNPVMNPSERRVYSPVTWSPDDSKLAVSIGYWEWGGLGIVSTADGALLSEFEFGETQTWSRDSQTFYSAHASEPGMIETVPGLFSISASPGATLQELVSGNLTWWPWQTQDLRLDYFIGTPDPTNNGQYSISLVSTDADGKSNLQMLRKDLLYLTPSGFSDAAWLPDGSGIVARLFHIPSQTSELLLIPVQDAPSTFLLPDASNLRFGK